MTHPWPHALLLASLKDKKSIKEREKERRVWIERERKMGDKKKLYGMVGYNHEN